MLHAPDIPESHPAPVAPSLFSVEEFDSFYLVSVDLPGLPEAATEILRDGKELSVRSLRGKIFHLKALREEGLMASYEDGSLWLLLPKDRHAKIGNPLP